MDVEITFLDAGGNPVLPPPVPTGASSSDPSIRQDTKSSDGRRIKCPVPAGATHVRIFLPNP